MVLRFPSAVFAVASSVVVYMIGRRLFSRTAGVVASGLYTVNFLQLILAQNARAYTLELLLLGLSWLSLFIALEGNRKRWWVAYVVATTLAIYAALFAGLVILSQVAALAALLASRGPWQARVRRSIRPIVASLAASFVLILPAGVDAYLHGGQNWVAPANLHDVRAFLHFAAGDSRPYEYVMLAGVVIAVFMAGLALFPRFARFTRTTRNDFGAAIALVAWFAMPIVIAFVLTQPQLNLHLFFPRYLVVVVPPMCLLAGLAVSALPLRLAQLGAVAALVAVAWHPMTFYYQLAQVQDFHTPVAWIQDRYQLGDGVVCEPLIACAVPMGYYFNAYPGRARLDADSPGQFDWATNSSTPISDESIDQYSVQHRRIFYVYAPLGPGDPATGDAARTQATLASHGYKVVDRIKAHATGADTTVVLFEAP
jgi:4-amino-4-deoxy-L-arabinose transferase-like glycosyltransferase